MKKVNTHAGVDQMTDTDLQVSKQHDVSDLARREPRRMLSREEIDLESSARRGEVRLVHKGD